MEAIIELDSEDIKKIIAEHFKVNERSVVFTVKRFTAGYGKGEHYEFMPIVTVKIKN